MFFGATALRAGLLFAAACGAGVVPRLTWYFEGTACNSAGGTEESFSEQGRVRTILVQHCNSNSELETLRHVIPHPQKSRSNVYACTPHRRKPRNNVYAIPSHTTVEATCTHLLTTAGKAEATCTHIPATHAKVEATKLRKTRRQLTTNGRQLMSPSHRNPADHHP